jgi:hypothetical protein
MKLQGSFFEQPHRKRGEAHGYQAALPENHHEISENFSCQSISEELRPKQ